MSLFDPILTNPWLFYPFFFIFSLCIGSFLNVVILRLPRMMEQEWRGQCEMLLEVPEGQRGDEASVTLSRPRSTCPHCGHQIRAIENIPVLSYLFLRGKCASCGAGISARYPMIELVTALFSLFTFYWFGYGAPAFWALVLVWGLIALTVIDYDTQLLPDNITLPLLWLGLILNYFGLFTDIGTALWGAVAGYLSLWSVYWLFKLATGKEGMGHGDFKLLAALGAWLGWELLPAIILLSSLVGAIVGITLILFRSHGREVPIPFGPYLAAAGLLCLWFGPEILSAWYGYLGVR